jgi:hypothetical protein
MPDIEGHEFAPYVWAAWPVHVERSDGTSITAGNEAEVDAFLKGDPAAIAAHAARIKMQADVRAIEVKADADIAKIRHDARAAILKVQGAAMAPAAPVMAPRLVPAPMPAPGVATATVAPPAAAQAAPTPVPGQLRPPVSTTMPPLPSNPQAAMQQESLNTQAASQLQNQDGKSGAPS